MQFPNICGYQSCCTAANPCLFTPSEAPWPGPEVEASCSFITTTVLEQRPRSHHMGTTGRVQTGDQLYPVLCHSSQGCQFEQDMAMTEGIIVKVVEGVSYKLLNGSIGGFEITIILSQEVTLAVACKIWITLVLPLWSGSWQDLVHMVT